MKRLLHSIAHRLSWFTGKVETWWDGGRLMVGFRCDDCGDLTGVHEAPDYIVYPER